MQVKQNHAVCKLLSNHQPEIHICWRQKVSRSGLTTDHRRSWCDGGCFRFCFCLSNLARKWQLQPITQYD